VIPGRLSGRTGKELGIRKRKEGAKWIPGDISGELGMPPGKTDKKTPYSKTRNATRNTNDYLE